MQILSRAASERISIGSEITLCVIAVNGTSVRLGVEAPRDISVHRDEIYKRIRDRNTGRLASGELAKD
ncbi:carbon storage regulator CsrA [Pseudomonas sp. NKUCC02_KPG]|uniref:carbon storage regulator CsrA n=1 Tax=Pseudomonas sp. NKUCC02_KPG TaxID=2842124 RepID=UPI001C5B4A54|nr:carbon storage regulator CsrA [Pseudomonas sp. NKUCC02_KPG]MBW3503199.1 carbon storage regulator CsrA [Pseudomonas sp. NKUCC02_KPG]